MSLSRRLAVCLGLLLAPAASSAQGGVVRLPEVVVPGVVQRPGAVYVLQRARPPATERDLGESFLDEVVRSVREGPF